MIANAREMTESEFCVGRDRQIEADVMAALASSKYGPLRKLRCRVRDGVVEISGTVGTFYLKQLAQSAVLQLNSEQLYGGGTVRNLVEVCGEPALLVATSCQTLDEPCGR